MEDIGYKLAWRVLDAQFFGVAQRRRRVFIIGHHRDGCAARVLFESDTVIFQAVERRLVSSTLNTQEVNGGGGSWVGGTVIADSPDGPYRKFTGLERERMQGFPDNWTAGELESARRRMTGNAVAVPVAEWLGRRIVAVHRSLGWD